MENLNLENQEIKLPPAFSHNVELEEKENDKELVTMGRCACFCDSARQMPAKVAAFAFWAVVG